MEQPLQAPGDLSLRLHLKGLKSEQKELNGKLPDCLVIHHMEPDHSANIDAFMEKYPNTKIFASAGAFNMMKNLFMKVIMRQTRYKMNN